MRRGQAVPAWHARAKSRGGVGEKKDGARVSKRVGTKGCAGSYVHTDTDEWSSRYRRPDADVRALVRLVFLKFDVERYSCLGTTSSDVKHECIPLCLIRWPYALTLGPRHFTNTSRVCSLREK
jgi:hypothetical protein